MAFRQAAQQQNIGEAAAQGRIKQKNMAAGKRTTRRALGDIGNLVTVPGVDGKLAPQITRPVTRGYKAQLLANAKAENNKNTLAANPNGDNNGCGRAPKPIQKKAVSIKSEPTETSSGSNQEAQVKEKQEKPVPVIDKETKSTEMSGKKKVQTLTSILTARSKAACGLSNKPKAADVMDIDAGDADNDLAVVEYVEDMYKFYKSAEEEGRAYNYMGSQPEINEKMRAILIDWLVQVHHKFELSPETLYLTINIVDRYLGSKATSRKELQLVGMSAMLIASKYEEIWAPEVNDLVCVSDNTYTHGQVLAMEKRILGQLEWNLTVPTPYVFLVRFIKASMTDSDVENMAYFLAELGMMNYETLIHSPSKIAASAVYAARCTLSKSPPFWTQTLETHTGFSEQELMDCVRLLVQYHSVAAEQKLRGIYRKYSSPEKGAVAVSAPAKSLMST